MNGFMQFWMVIFTLIGFGMHVPLHGQGTLFFSPGDFHGPTTLIDFESFPNGASAGPYAVANIANQWNSLGVYISDSTPENGAALFYSTAEEVPTYGGTNGVAPSFAGRGGFLLFRFVDPLSGENSSVPEAGLWTVNGAGFGGMASTITFFGADGIPLQSVETTGTYFFAGIRYEPGISAIRISDPDYFLSDNLQFGPVSPVPEPSTWSLLGLGAMLALVLRRQRIRTARIRTPRRCMLLFGRAPRFSHKRL